MKRRKSEEEQPYSAQDKGEASFYSDVEGKKGRLENQDKSVNTNPKNQTLFTQNKTTSEERQSNVLVEGASHGSSTSSTEMPLDIYNAYLSLSLGSPQYCTLPMSYKRPDKVSSTMQRTPGYMKTQQGSKFNDGSCMGSHILPFLHGSSPTTSNTSVFQGQPSLPDNLQDSLTPICSSKTRDEEGIVLTSPIPLSGMHRQQDPSKDPPVPSVSHSQLPWHLSSPYQQRATQYSSKDPPVPSVSHSQLPWHLSSPYQQRATQYSSKDPPATSVSHSQLPWHLSSPYQQRATQYSSKDPPVPSVSHSQLPWHPSSPYQQRATQYSSKDPPVPSVSHSQLPWHLSSPYQPISRAVQLSSDTNCASPYLPLNPHGLMQSDRHSKTPPLSRRRFSGQCQQHPSKDPPVFTQNKTTSEERQSNVLVEGASHGSSTSSTEMPPDIYKAYLALSMCSPQYCTLPMSYKRPDKVSSTMQRTPGYMKTQQGSKFNDGSCMGSHILPFLHGSSQTTSNTSVFQGQPSLPDNLQDSLTPICSSKTRDEEGIVLTSPIPLSGMHRQQDPPVPSVSHSQLPWHLSSPYQQRATQYSSKDPPVPSVSHSQLPWHLSSPYQQRATQYSSKDPPATSVSHSQLPWHLSSPYQQRATQYSSKDPPVPSVSHSQLPWHPSSPYQQRTTQYSSKDPPVPSVSHSQLPWHLSSPYQPISRAVQLSSDTNCASPYLPLNPHSLMQSDRHSKTPPLSRRRFSGQCQQHPSKDPPVPSVTHSELPRDLGTQYRQGATQYSSNDPPVASSNYVPFPLDHHSQEINEREREKKTINKKKAVWHQCGLSIRPALLVPLSAHTFQPPEILTGSACIIPAGTCRLPGRSNKEILKDDANGFCLVQSENEPGIDNKLPGGTEPPIMIEHFSATNTLPAHSNLQLSSTDSCWTRKMSNHLPHFHSIPSLSKLDVAKNNLTRTKSLPDILLKDSFDEFTPDITVDENEETYRFHCSRQGLYQCSVTGLVFHMEGKGDVVYRIVSWNRRLLTQHHKKPAGPLFDIKCLQQQSVCQLHLPHCEIRSTGGCGFLSVAHVNDEGIEFITPHKITETHVIINITEFSGFGNVKDEDSPPDPVRALVLLFYRPPTDPDPESLLNVLLLPKNIVLRDVKHMRKKLVGNERYIETSPHCKLLPKQVYTLSTSPEDDSVLVQPTEAEFDEESYDNYFPSFQVNLNIVMRNIKLYLKDKNSSCCVWERQVCLLSTGVTKPRRQCLPSNERLMDIRTCFIDGISGPVLKSLLDKMFEKKVITDSERESADEIQNKSDKARFVIDTVRKKGEAASSEMIEFLCEVDPFLCKHLGWI